MRSTSLKLLASLFSWLQITEYDPVLGYFLLNYFEEVECFLMEGVITAQANIRRLMKMAWDGVPDPKPEGDPITIFDDNANVPITFERLLDPKTLTVKGEVREDHVFATHEAELQTLTSHCSLLHSCSFTISFLVTGWAAKETSTLGWLSR